jgi:hypothetical protein
MAYDSLFSFYSMIIKWLEQLIQTRISSEIILVSDNNRWNLSVHQSVSTINIITDRELFKIDNRDLPCGYWIDEQKKWDLPLHSSLPMVGVECIDRDLLEKTENGYTINYDILGLAYWMMTRIEEVDSQELDDRDRFPATASHAYKYGYLDRPIVDEWFFILRQVVQRLWPQLPLVEHKFQMRVSHDVDNPSRYAFATVPELLRLIVGDVIKRKDLLTAIKAPFLWSMPTKEKLNPVDPYNTFDWLMDISDRHGLKSAFYFICGRTNSIFDGDYEIEHPAIRHLLKHIHDRGHEIGLHPSYETYKKPELIRAEADRLRKVCLEEGITQSEWGGRMHFLRWETPTTLYGWEKAQMSYDTSLSYADLPGFRCGTCFEYQAFDPVKMEPLSLRIRPLIAMECTIMAERYMGLGTTDAAHQKFIQLKNACKSVGGTFTLLWHNSQLLRNREKLLYEGIIAELNILRKVSIKSGTPINGEQSSKF